MPEPKGQFLGHIGAQKTLIGKVTYMKKTDGYSRYFVKVEDPDGNRVTLFTDDNDFGTSATVVVDGYVDEHEIYDGHRVTKFADASVETRISYFRPRLGTLIRRSGRLLSAKPVQPIPHGGVMLAWDIEVSNGWGDHYRGLTADPAVAVGQPVSMLGNVTGVNIHDGALFTTFDAVRCDPDPD